MRSMRASTYVARLIGECSIGIGQPSQFLIRSARRVTSHRWYSTEESYQRTEPGHQPRPLPEWVSKEVNRFDAKVPVESAKTPPASW